MDHVMMMLMEQEVQELLKKVKKEIKVTTLEI